MSKNDDPIKKYVYFSSLAFEMLAAILIGGGIGYFIDKHYHHETLWVTLVGFLLGLLAAFYMVFKQLKQNE